MAITEVTSLKNNRVELPFCLHGKGARILQSFLKRMKLNYKTTAQLDTNFVPNLKVYFITKLIGNEQIYPHKEI